MTETKGKKRGWVKGRPRKPKPEAAAEAPLPKTLSRGNAWAQKLKASAEGTTWRDTTEDNRLALSPEDQAWLKDHGLVAEWKTASVFGREETRHMSQLRKNGWAELPDDVLPSGRSVKEDGAVLMARSKHLSEKARAADAVKAREPIQARMAMAEGGIPVSGGDHVSARKTNFIRRSIERIDVPTDAAEG
jgi:hypothetical protein